MIRTLSLTAFLILPTLAHASGDCDYRKDAKKAYAAVLQEYNQTPAIPALDKAMKNCTVQGLQKQQQVIYASPCTQDSNDNAFNQGMEVTKACSTDVMAKFQPPIVVVAPTEPATNPGPASIGASPGSGTGVGSNDDQDKDKTKPTIKVPVDMSAFGSRTAPSRAAKD